MEKETSNSNFCCSRAFWMYAGVCKHTAATVCSYQGNNAVVTFLKNTAVGNATNLQGIRSHRDLHSLFVFITKLSAPSLPQEVFNIRYKIWACETVTQNCDARMVWKAEKHFWILNTSAPSKRGSSSMEHQLLLCICKQMKNNKYVKHNVTAIKIG
jgi:hypothetical protein